MLWKVMNSQALLFNDMNVYIYLYLLNIIYDSLFLIPAGILHTGHAAVIQCLAIKS